MKELYSLEIVFSSEPEKQVELVQTINSVLGSSQSYIFDYNLSKVGNRISFTAELENESDLNQAISSREMNLIYGTSRTLGIKYEAFINGLPVHPGELFTEKETN